MESFWPSRSPWLPVGLSSSFPDLGLEDDKQPITGVCNSNVKTGCKVFRIQETAGLIGTTESLEEISQTTEMGDSFNKQLVVFQYKGKIHAMDHVCPHSSYPLSQGALFDIEDFGVVLSAGITCPQHGWSFDLFTGRSDRANYQLKLWEVELRDIKGSKLDTVLRAADDHSSREEIKEVWVRRKPQMIG